MRQSASGSHAHTPATNPSIVIRFRLYRALRCIVGPVLAFRLTMARKAQA